MPSAAELKAQLRELRKESMKPVSRMKVADIAAEIQRLKGVREETPLPAATPSSTSKRSKSAVSTIQEAKQHQFPVTPDQGITASPKKGAKIEKAPKNIVPAAVAESKKKSKLAKLMEMMDSDDE